MGSRSGNPSTWGAIVRILAQTTQYSAAGDPFFATIKVEIGIDSWPHRWTDRPLFRR